MTQTSEPFEIQPPGATSSRFATLPPLLGSPSTHAFVGRDDELERLRSLWAAARRGERRLAWISGEPGIGKTRLAAELARMAAAEGAAVLAGRCDEQVVGAYQPFVQALQPYLRALSVGELRAQLGWGAEEMARLVPELTERLPGLTSPATPGESERFRLFEAVATLLNRAAAASSVLLVLDDLHWADQPTLLLLRHLARHPDPAAILIVATYRDTETAAGGMLATTLADLRADRRDERIRLEGLSAAAIATMTSSAGPGQDPQAPLVELLRGETSGNPYFVEEVLRHLTEVGVLGSDRALVSSDALRQVGLPDSIREVLGRRLNKLSATTNQVLRIAAVAGQEFSLDLVEALAELPAQVVLESLEEAGVAGLVTEQSDAAGCYAFSHALVRQTAYTSLSTTRRLRLHARAGEVLEALSADGDDHLAEMAYHFLQAGPGATASKAVTYASRAGEQALAQLAYEEAADHFRRALDLVGSLEEADEARRIDLLLLLGEAQWKSSETALAKRTYVAAAASARQRGDAERLARAALGYGTALGGYVHAVRADGALIGLLEEALGALGPRQGKLRARLLATLAVELYYTPFAARRAAVADEAVAVAERLGDPTVELMARHARAWATLGPDRPLVERLNECAEIIRRAELLDDLALGYQGHFLAQIVHLEAGDLTAADAEMACAAAIAAELRIPAYQPWLTAYRAMRATVDGRFDEGDQLAQEAFDQAVAHMTDPEAVETIIGGQQIAQRIFRGGVEDFVPVLRTMVADNPQHPMIATFLPFAYRELDCAAEAREAFEQVARAGFGAIPRDANWLMGIWALSLSCTFLGDAARAGELYDLLVPFADRWVTAAVSICLGPVAIALGALATTLGEFDAAARHLESALMQAAAIPAPGLLAHARHEYACMLLARRAAGDDSSAQRLLHDALRTADELSMESLGRKIKAVMPSA